MSTRSVKTATNIDLDEDEKTPPSISQRSIAKASGSQRRTNDVSVIKTPSPRKRRGAETPKSKESSSSPRVSPHPKRAQRNKSVEKHSDERPEYEVEAVVGKRVNSKKKAEYQVKWKGYKQLSWEPLANLHCADLIQAYEDLIENNVKKSLSPAVKRKSMSRAAKTSPKPLVTKTAAAGSAKKRSPAHTSKTPVTNNRPRRGSSKSQVKVRTQSSARKSPLAKAKKSIQQVSFLDKTAEEFLEL
uniref:Chromo domain-containing protein n=1 Tax=Ditylenchus dipsaci TaxID=166011 RepID=A0A915EML7_9BILA